MVFQVTDMENDMSPVQEDEGPNAVSQLAKKMQGAGARSWNRLSALFNKEDEHQLLEESEKEPPRPTRRTGFWDSFAANWAAKKQAEAAAAAANEAAAGQGDEMATEAEGDESQDGQITEGEESEGGGGRSNNSFSRYVSLGGGSEETSLKWNFVTSKLAELKSKSMTKTN
uniref:Chromosome 16 C1orf232 homolog n=1 Tax=Mastacembelus armatus TaxID=205130 RepID=A0A3Q3LSP9_9TELE